MLVRNCSGFVQSAQQVINLESITVASNASSQNLPVHVLNPNITLELEAAAHRYGLTEKRAIAAGLIDAKLVFCFLRNDLPRLSLCWKQRWCTFRNPTLHTCGDDLFHIRYL